MPDKIEPLNNQDWAVYLNDSGVIVINRIDKRPSYLTGFIRISPPKPDRLTALDFAANYVKSLTEEVTEHGSVFQNQSAQQG